MQDVKEAIQHYASFGFDSLPLEPGTKKAQMKGWPNLSPEQMWQRAPANANVGVRGGGPAHLAVIDCDDKEVPGTYGNFLNWFDGLGYGIDKLVIVETASKIGRHIYVTFNDVLDGHARNVSKSFGAGEFRFGPGAYVVAPPSEVQHNLYTLLAGNFYQLPTLSTQDVLQFLDLKVPGNKEPVPLIPDPEGYIPERTMKLLKGQGVENYQSRSQAEQAILTGLVNVNIDFESTLRLFEKYPAAGRFQEEFEKSSSKAADWLRNSYDQAVIFANSQESKPRQLAQAAIVWAKSRPWPGRHGQYDKQVYIAHANIAYKAGRYEYGASARYLATMTNLSPMACMKATRRLCEAQLIILVKEWVADRSNTYRLVSQTFTLPHSSLG